MEKFKYNTIDEAIAAIKAGQMVLVTDDEDRENEGDLIMAAELCTPEAINFMAKEARGLICMPADSEVMDKLQFGAMVTHNTDNHETAFSVSIDHVDTTTGISAYERAYTMKKCAEPGAQPSDFRRPGHVFPLRARKGGVLVRTGHTETTVDLCKLAGLQPVGICCEIMNDDGHMARTPDLIEFAKKHKLVFITVAELVAYRRHTKKWCIVPLRLRCRLNTAISALLHMKTIWITFAMLLLSRVMLPVKRTCSCAYTASA